MQRSAMHGMLAVSVVATLLEAAVASGQMDTGKCGAAKLTCAANRATGLLACHEKAESKGDALDATCVTKVTAKFSDPATEKGCIEKAEAKSPCLTSGDAASLAGVIDGFVDDVVTAVDPTYPALVLDKCSTGKKKCVATKVKALLGCYGKAAKKGVAVDPACVATAKAQFDGGTKPPKGCFEKLEAKYGPANATPCQTFDDTADVETTVDDFASTMNTIIDPPSRLTFTLSGAPGGTCGESRDGAGNVLRSIPCGSLLFGTGGSISTTGLTPPGTTSVFSLDCKGSGCTVGPTSTSPRVNTADPDCTTTGCRFGSPLPLPNPVIPSISICVQTTWSAPASGTLDLGTGRWMPNVPLGMDIYLTGNLSQPCPRCSASGSPGTPGTGTCDRGQRAGLACTTTNETGLTRDCATGGANPPSQPCIPGGGVCIDGSYVGTFIVDLSPLTTATSTLSSATGTLCPFQVEVGCFGSPACRSIEVRGTPAGSLMAGIPASATIGSAFCVPPTGNGMIDAGAGVPAPGAAALTGVLVVE